MEQLRAVLESALGTVHVLEEEAPGLWYCAVQETEKACSSEYYLVELGRDILTIRAKAYGKPLNAHPEMLLFSIDEADSGYQVVRYELELYRYKLQPTVQLLEELRSAAVFGAENHPEYFGAFPAPLDTPQGRTLRSMQLYNGVWCLETDRGARMVAFCYPIWRSTLSPEVAAYGEQSLQDLTLGIDSVCGYLFFPWETSCLPLYEWLQFHPEVDSACLRGLNKAALQNMICRRFPDYVLRRNKQARACWPDRNVEEDENSPIIRCCPEAGYVFLDF